MENKKNLLPTATNHSRQWGWGEMRRSYLQPVKQWLIGARNDLHHAVMSAKH